MGAFKLSRYHGMRFAVFMFVTYGALSLGYYKIPDGTLDEIYHHALAVPSSAVINWLSPGEHAVSVGNELQSMRATLAIVRGCDGSGAWFLVSAAMIAFPASWRLRILGIFLGAAFVYSLNLVRLVGLFFVAGHGSQWFLTMHTYFVPTLLVVGTCLFFMQWADVAARGSHEAG